MLDQREFLNLSSFESRGKNSSKGEVKRSEEFGCREEENISISETLLLLGYYRYTETLTFTVEECPAHKLDWIF